MGPFDWLPYAPLEPLALDWLNGVELAVLRLDRIDPLISGNKWFKLTEHLAQAHQAGASGVIGLGGAYSNHLHALAAAGKAFWLCHRRPAAWPCAPHAYRRGSAGIWHTCIGWVSAAIARAMSRVSGRPGVSVTRICIPCPKGAAGWRAQRVAGCWSSKLARRLSHLGWADYDAWWLAAGTGTTLAGLVLAEAGAHLVYGAMAVPHDHGVAQNVSALVQGGYQLLDASQGGFAKVDPLLRDFIETTEQACGVPLEPLYTGKALLALKHQVEAGHVARHSPDLCAHRRPARPAWGFSRARLTGIMRNAVLSRTT